MIFSSAGREHFQYRVNLDADRMVARRPTDVTVSRTGLLALTRNLLFTGDGCLVGSQRIQFFAVCIGTVALLTR